MKDPAFVLYQPYGPLDYELLASESIAGQRADELIRVGIHATALIGHHSADELFAALRRERAKWLAAKVDDGSRFPCCSHCQGFDGGHPVPCVACRQNADLSADQLAARAMNAGVA